MWQNDVKLNYQQFKNKSQTIAQTFKDVNLINKIYLKAPTLDKYLAMFVLHQC
jgi:hypothetical protein